MKASPPSAKVELPDGIPLWLAEFVHEAQRETDTLRENGAHQAATARAPTAAPWDLTPLLHVPRTQIPALVGDLERLKATLLARLVDPEARQRSKEDPLLTADQVAERMQVDRKWVYRHKAKLGAVKLSRKKLRFPSSEVERYLRRRKAASRGR